MTIDFKKLELSDRKIFDTYFNFYKPQAGELTFSNLHTWDCVYNSYFLEYEGYLCIVCGFDDEKFSLMPIDCKGTDKVARLARVITMLRKHFEMISTNLNFRRITEAESVELDEASKILNCNFEIEFDRDNSDYVYRYDVISCLHGKKFHSKRNHIQNLINTEYPEYFSLTPELLPECMKILEHWHLDKIEDLEMQHDRKSQITFINNYEKYGRCRGGLIKLNGIFKAYTIGEMLNENTLVVHSEKADGSIRGLYPYINQQFLLNEWQGIEFVNREQDCGSEGLRKAKLSYHPDHFEKKYTVSLNNE